jgi:Fe-S cluster assembly iron-binding protein IscA
MVQITERASAELRRLLTDNFARPQQGVRLRLNDGGRSGDDD